jgi:ubiquinone/menaquinone biosynthesis C-methylase UbiE
MEAIYNKIGNGYDITRKADPEILATFANLLTLNPSYSYLDIACGTGNYTAELSKLGGHWYGFDQSKKMLDEAIAKSSAIKWQQCDVTNIRHEDNQFDGAICSLAIHHFKDLRSAFVEIYRVIKPNAPLVIFTSTQEQMKDYWLTHYFPDMMEKSSQQMPRLTDITAALHENNFTVTNTLPFFVTTELKDSFLYSGKQQPELYLLESFRNGISSFKNFCSIHELQASLLKLKNDIESRDITHLINETKNKSDYLFLTAITTKN